MKKLFLIFTFLNRLAVYGQETIIVDTVVFTETIEKQTLSDIPYTKDVTGGQSKITRKINAAIQDRFMIESFDPKSVTSFTWYGVTFAHQIKENVLHISFQGEYAGAYFNNIHDNLYFDLKTGDLLDEKLIPLHCFFSPEGYFNFLNKFWLPGCSAEYKEATVCADSAPYCDCYDINFDFTGSKLELSLTDDCFPHVARACSPYSVIEVSLDTVQPFLSDFGRYVLLESNYATKNRLERFLFYRKQFQKIPNYWYAVGSIGNKYPFSMALQLPENHSNGVTGYYFYEKQKTKIPLSGSINGQQIVLTERVDGKITGRIQLTWHDEFQDDGIAVEGKYLTGTWTDAQNGKTFKISFLDFKKNK